MRLVRNPALRSAAAKWYLSIGSLRCYSLRSIGRPVNERVGNLVLTTAIQWYWSDPLVATVSGAAPGHPPVAPGQVRVVIHAVAAGRANVVGCSGHARDSIGVTVVRDTAVYGGY